MGRKRKSLAGSVGTIRLKDLITDVSHRTGVSKVQVELIIREVFSSIKYYLHNRMNVEIARFGVFNLLKLRGTLFNLPNGVKVWKDERLSCRFKFSTKFVAELLKVNVKDEDTDENNVDNITL